MQTNSTGKQNKFEKKRGKNKEKNIYCPYNMNLWRSNRTPPNTDCFVTVGFRFPAIKRPRVVYLFMHRSVDFNILFKGLPRNNDEKNHSRSILGTSTFCSKDGFEFPSRYQIHSTSNATPTPSNTREWALLSACCNNHLLKKKQSKLQKVAMLSYRKPTTKTEY